MGHFFMTAAGVSTAFLAQYTIKRAVREEFKQEKEREKIERLLPVEREKYIGPSWEKATPEQKGRRGVAWSAFTIEDLPSDAFGAEFGSYFIKHPWADILSRMKEFFSKQGAVDATSNRDKMWEETHGSKDPEKLPRQHFSTTPVLLDSARKLCGR